MVAEKTAKILGYNIILVNGTKIHIPSIKISKEQLELKKKSKKKEIGLVRKTIEKILNK